MNNPIAAWMPLNLQFFADPVPEDSLEQSAEGNAPAADASQNTPPALTLEDVMRIVQSESDKRVTQALAKQRKEYEKKLSLSGLDEHERTLKERDQRIEELETSLREEQATRNHLELVRTLAAREMPVEFADLIDVGTNLEEAQQRIEKLDAAFKKAVEEAVNKRLAGRSAPARGNTGASMTREDIMKITDAAERQQAIANNIELFRRS